MYFEAPDLPSAAQSCAIRMALDDLHGLLQKSHHNPCTFTSRCVNKCFGNKTFVSIPRGFFAILLSHDGFFYQEVLMMMQSEAVIHVPTPGCRKHAFLPERNGRRGGTLLTTSPIQSWRIVCSVGLTMGCPMVLDGPAAGGAPDFEKVRTETTEVPKIPPPGDAWLVPIISMHGACTNYPCASNW